MTTARAMTLGALVVAAALVAILLLGGNGAHQYKLVFQTAGQLVNDNDVQVGGRRVGSVKDIQLTANNQAEITIEVDKPYAPLHEGTTAVIRATSLSGVANRYIALSPGPDNAPKLADGAVLAADRTTTIVDLDQLFNTLDAPTRKGLAETIQGFATWYAGKGLQANAAGRYFPPALSATTGVLQKLNADQAALNTLVQDTSQVVTTLARKAPTLTDLVSNADTTFGAIASENASLSQALSLLPQTLRRGSTTFVDLRLALDDVDKLVAASKPASKNLAPFLATLRPLLTESQPTIAQLARLVRQPGASNDLTDLLTTAPQLANVASTSFPSAVTALGKSTPVFNFIRPYTPDLVGWLRDFGQGASNYDANGHFARVAPVFNAFKYDASNDTLVPVPPALRTPGLENGPSIVQRCPGAAIQRPADGSAPWQDTGGKLDCQSSIVPPGP